MEKPKTKVKAKNLFEAGDIVKVRGHFAKVLSSDDKVVHLTKYGKDIAVVHADDVKGLTLNGNAINTLGIKKATAKDMEALELPVDKDADASETDAGDDKTKEGDDDVVKLSYVVLEGLEYPQGEVHEVDSILELTEEEAGEFAEGLIELITPEEKKSFLDKIKEKLSK